METAMLPAESEAAVEEPVASGAEATRNAAHLFQYSEYVHAGAGAAECEHAQDGKCVDEGHFHAWVCLPNSLQHRDILEKARAAKARRKRALRDAGADGRPPSDAYVLLESELDDVLLDGDREDAIGDLAGREVRKRMQDLIRKVIDDDSRFENYYQDAEEWRRLDKLPEDQRGEEFAALDALMTDFEEQVKSAVAAEDERQRKALEALDGERLRDALRKVRIEIDAADAHLHTYYTWLGFIGTRVVSAKQSIGAARYFRTLEDFKSASPEAVDAVDGALRDLETRMNRGDAAGNS